MEQPELAPRRKVELAELLGLPVLLPAAVVVAVGNLVLLELPEELGYSVEQEAAEHTALLPRLMVVQVPQVSGVCPEVPEVPARLRQPLCKPVVAEAELLGQALLELVEMEFLAVEVALSLAAHPDQAVVG